MPETMSPSTRESNLKMVAGEAALDGSNPTSIQTGLKSIVGVALTIKASTTPGDAVSILTYDILGGTIDVYAWVHTATDPTLVASTATHTFSYVAMGY